MALKEKNNTKGQDEGLSGIKILTGVLYTSTFLFILGFFWQSVVSVLQIE